MKLISIGFGNAVAAARILAVVSPDSAPIKRVVQEARERGMLLDASFGRRTKSVLLLDTDHVILSSVTPGDDLRAYGRKNIGGDEFAAMKGKLFAISGPSGVGKNSVLSVMQLRDRVQYSISATSRPMRPGEIDGKSYYFVTRAQFEQMIAAGELLENMPNMSATTTARPLKPIQAALAAGTDVVMDVDVVGALNIKKRLPEAVLVFMAAPSMAEIRRRLASRGDVPPELMEKRMDRAKWEYSQAGQYDYLVVNDTVEHAAQELLAIMTAEKCKMMDRIHCIKEEL